MITFLFLFFFFFILQKSTCICICYTSFEHRIISSLIYSVLKPMQIAVIQNQKIGDNTYFYFFYINISSVLWLVLFVQFFNQLTRLFSFHLCTLVKWANWTIYLISCSRNNSCVWRSFEYKHFLSVLCFDFY